MNLYVVAQQAVYRHAICGIFSDLQEAIDCANKNAKEDYDAHHDYIVFPFILNEWTKVDRDWKTSPFIEQDSIHCANKRDFK